MYDSIPVDDLIRWSSNTREEEQCALDAAVPGSLEECEAELDKHEVSRESFL